ncbi:hypothetical protein DM01DRAFT_1301255 [Hesseltinella vesiculosa]|uniref:Oxidoreductase AflY n=1 Tax=Hesseltinella vesiculosa TaxID=101127 RepID=A0A1X2GS05_9FUNG|nr:hypothetical protein DM01DRAFT_1301255 [Hesseltinella vesiculosa]
MSFFIRTPLRPELTNLVLPGITSRSTTAVVGLLEKNNRDHHIFFNEFKYHNHLSHHVLAAYALGADEKRLEEIYNAHLHYQRPRPPLLEKVTRANFTAHLDKAEAYTSYLEFFQDEIKQHGIINTVRRFVWSGDMLSRLLGGALHPLIHVGYGVEFSSEGMVAEGLAMAACTSNMADRHIPTSPELSEQLRAVPAQQLEERVEGDLLVGDSILVDIVNEIHSDKFYDTVVQIDTKIKSEALIQSDAAMEKITGYLTQWVNKTAWQSQADRYSRVKELVQLCTLAYGATGFTSKDPQVLPNLDFFLMHALTSVYFVHILVPHLHPEEANSLIQNHLLMVLSYYTAFGRPKVRAERLIGYESVTFGNDEPNDWSHVFKEAIKGKDEHVIKVVRSLALAQMLYGHGPDDLGQAYIKAAQASLDVQGQWSRDVGFLDFE